MSKPCRIASVLLMASLLGATALARADATPQAQSLVPFASTEGLERLARSTAKSDFAPLANQFEAQATIAFCGPTIAFCGPTIAFCGPTTAAIVLNTLRPSAIETPRDRSRLRPEDDRYLPKTLQLTVPRHTQESVIATGKKTRAQVFGEPATINGKLMRDGGYQLRQLDELLKAHSLATRLVIVDAQTAEADIRRDLIDNLNRPGDVVIVNYQRAAVGQSGGGHISPLAAYDTATDSVLILDVNPSHYPWVWMPVSILIRGMRTRDVVENRGYILVQTH